jgi:inositol transport system permease protein
MSANEAAGKSPQVSGVKPHRRLPQELSILVVLAAIVAVFELLGWPLKGQSFLFNPGRLSIIFLQVAVIGIIAVGVAQTIITAGVDLSSGSVVGATAMIAASFAQVSTARSIVYPHLADMPFIVPVLAGLAAGLLAGVINGALIAYANVPPFIATLGMMVSARGFATWYTNGQPVSTFTPSFSVIGSSTELFGIIWINWPTAIFLAVALIFHIAMCYTRYGKFTYAIGSNMQAARVSGIDVKWHLVKVYGFAGLLSGLAGVVQIARAGSGQASAGFGYELQAIAAVVIGGTSLSGGVGRITSTVIGLLILSVVQSGFTFVGVQAAPQQIVLGAIIVTAVVIDQYRRNKRRKA